ncbi:putative farnesyltransferase alpha subunit [Ixodes scapularis]
MNSFENATGFKMADGDEVDSGKWVFYRDRPEWKDVTPVPQDDGRLPVVRIAYSEQFQDIFDYFRAVLKLNERSERALELVTDAVDINTSNYTVWHYRRALLKDLGKDLHEELTYIQKVIEDNPKNYQVWHHRRVLVEWLHDASLEKAFTESVLRMDAKNYHAWQHRQWAISEFDLWDGELDYVSTLLQDDVRNNSAWNQRFYIISNTTGFTEAVLDREVAYTFECIRKAVHNESPWNYLRGILDAADAGKRSDVDEFCERLYAEGCRVAYLLAFMVDSMSDKLAAIPDERMFRRALEFCEQLAEEEDVIRKEYWNFVARGIEGQYAKTTDGVGASGGVPPVGDAVPSTA